MLAEEVERQTMLAAKETPKGLVCKIEGLPSGFRDRKLIKALFPDEAEVGFITISNGDEASSAVVRCRDSGDAEAVAKVVKEAPAVEEFDGLTWSLVTGDDERAVWEEFWISSSQPQQKKGGKGGRGGKFGGKKQYGRGGRR